MTFFGAQFFFNHSGDDFSVRVREEFRCFPDEFVDAETGITAAKELGEKPDLKKQVDTSFVASYRAGTNPGTFYFG